jgi:hypothetical protein
MMKSKEKVVTPLLKELLNITHNIVKLLQEQFNRDHREIVSFKIKIYDFAEKIFPFMINDRGGYMQRKLYYLLYIFIHV